MNRSEYMQLYYQKNKDRLKEYVRKYSKTHREHKRKYEKRYREEHRDYKRKYMKTWHKQHKEHNKKYYEKNRKRLSKNRTQRLHNIKLEIVKLLGAKCSNPYNFEHPDWLNNATVLQIDHVSGEGIKERKLYTGMSYYKHVKKKIENGSKDYQLLCPACNWHKRYRNKEGYRRSI